MTSPPLIIDLSIALHFQSCLIHFINYQSLDLSPISFPAVLSWYTDSGMNWKESHCTPVLMNAPWKITIEGTVLTNKSCQEYEKIKTHLKRLDKLSNAKWNCLAQFYLYPLPKIVKDSFGISDKIMHVPLEYFDFGIKNNENDDGKIAVTSRSAFRFLISAEELSRNMFLYWNAAMEISLKFYIATHLLHVITTAHSTNINNTYIICLVCSRYRNTLDKISFKDINVSGIENLYRYYFFNHNDIPVFFETINLENIHGIVLFEEHTNHHSKFEKQLTRKLYQIAFPNFTQISWSEWVEDWPRKKEPLVSNNCQRQSECFASATTKFVKTDFEFNSRILLKSSGISYITCFNPQDEHISFRGFLSAFDTFTWMALLTVSIVSLGVSLKAALTYSHGSTHEENKNLDIVLGLIGLLLEQGQRFTVGVHIRKGSALWAIIPALFGGLIISNAYKGENINQITAPLSAKKFDTLDAVKKNEFKIFSSQIPSDDPVKMGNNTLLEKLLKNEKETDNRTDFSWLLKVHSPLPAPRALCIGRSIFVREHMALVKDPKHNINFPKNFTYVCDWEKTFLNELIHCSKAAYFGEEDFLKLNLLPALRYTGTGKVMYHLGQERIHTTVFATTLVNLRLPYIEKWIQLLHATGLMTQVLQVHENQKKKKMFSSIHITGFGVEDFKNQTIDEKDTAYVQALRKGFTQLKANFNYFILGKAPNPPVSLTIRGNMVALFVLIVAFLFLSSINFLIEILRYKMEITTVRIYIRVNIQPKPSTKNIKLKK